VQNGIVLEPRVKIERSTNDFVDEADWPPSATSTVDVFLHATATTAAGKLGMLPDDGVDALTFTDLSSQSEGTMVSLPDTVKTNRLAFLSPVLTQDVRVSGVPTMDLQASFNNRTDGKVGAILVDYSDTSFTRPSLSNDGVTDSGAPTNCWGDATALDSGCFPEPRKPTQNVTSWRVSKGTRSPMFNFLRIAMARQARSKRAGPHGSTAIHRGKRSRCSKNDQRIK